MQRRDPRSFLEDVLSKLEVHEKLKTKLIALAPEKAGNKRVAALVQAFEEEPNEDR